MSNRLFSILSPFQKIVESALFSKTSLFGPKTKLQEACQYALTCGGKRFRPALVLMVAKALQSSNDVMGAALSVEYFHTASLLADDLPCMDNDSERRGKPSTHVVYGEAVALLASYALIAEGYRSIAENAHLLGETGNAIGILAVNNASFNTGILGATGGQYLDLFPPKTDEATYLETVMKKTVALFEISFVFGWLFGGGNINQLDLVKKAAYHYGMAFQIADDFDDLSKDNALERTMNAASLFGKEKALSMFHEELNGYLTCLHDLHIHSNELVAIADVLLEEIANPC